LYHSALSYWKVFAHSKLKETELGYGMQKSCFFVESTYHNVAHSTLFWVEDKVLQSSLLVVLILI